MSRRACHQAGRRGGGASRRGAKALGKLGNVHTACGLRGTCAGKEAAGFVGQAAAMLQGVAARMAVLCAAVLALCCSCALSVCAKCVQRAAGLLMF